MLKAGPVTTGDFLRAGIGRFGARIAELRAVGWTSGTSAWAAARSGVLAGGVMREQRWRPSKRCIYLAGKIRSATGDTRSSRELTVGVRKPTTVRNGRGPAMWRTQHSGLLARSSSAAITAARTTGVARTVPGLLRQQRRFSGNADVYAPDDPAVDPSWAEKENVTLLGRQWVQGPDRESIVDRCRAAIDRADVVFAWFDDLTAFGSLVEVGYAVAAGKRVYVAMPFQSEVRRDLWFAHYVAGCRMFSDSPVAPMASWRPSSSIG